MRKSVIFLKRLGFVFFGLMRHVKNYPTNEIGAFAHVSGAAVRNDEEDIRQVASTLPASASFLIQQNNIFFIAGAGASGAWNIHVFLVWFWQARKYLLSSSEWQASVRSVKLCSATLCTGVFLFYIKRHLMSGNEFACSLGSSSAKIAWVWTQKTRWKMLPNNARRYSSRCVRALRLSFSKKKKLFNSCLISREFYTLKKHVCNSFFFVCWNFEWQLLCK